MGQLGSAARLSSYRYALLRFKALGRVRAFSQDIAAASGVTAAQVRKDFSVFQIPGNRKGGYDVQTLLDRITNVLGLDRANRFILAGVGNLGRALLGYARSYGDGIRIMAAFDVDPAKFSLDLGVPVMPLSQMPGFIQKEDIGFGIIAVPDFAAQQVMELMVGAGIRGILNFAPICLYPPSGCVIRNVNLAAELEGLVYAVGTQRETGQ
ncbi:MAG: redox-sensing transcriptional repressor Rex [Sedimentisphaerales bacterium]|jgi:redox-sensing transcriptional repressor|nr:redox-sensing transcriptional repressor Rex [Sedimentisphaerales bacterium]